MKIALWVFFIVTLNLSFCQAADLNRAYSLTFDRAGAPQDYVFMRYESSGTPYNWPESIPSNVNAMVCGSDSDSTNGACETNASENSSFPYLASYYTLTTDYGQDIRLRFTEQSTKLIKEIIVKGYLGNGCSAQYFSYYSGCKGDNSASLYLHILGEQLKLLTGGTWEATLKLYQRNSKNSSVNLGTWTINLTINVTDTGSQQIYFPRFNTASPVVNLNLNNRPGTGNNLTASGSSSLDMCLYDGSNSTSRQISLIFSDEGSPASNRAAGQFSVYRRGADKSQEANRLDYEVTVINPVTGASQKVSNGTEIVWQNTNQRNIQRQVVLPGVPGVSLCVPAPITLRTPSFSLSNKNAGFYTGQLKIIYTPTTQQ
ncbi:CfaE/CblD family pilus tip adhesin [Vibrio sp.]|uniref:CfaE/CblD family pilus tip adhesin n=1 Tax=Vibrio sp. TaxID=678 RepID=UPI003AA91C7B